MKLITCEKKDANIYRISLSDGTLFSLKTCYLDFDIEDLKDREIADEEVRALVFAADCLRVENVALELIARAEQSSFGIARKLESRGFSSKAVRAAMVELGEQGLLDDERYARLWIEDRLRPSSHKTESPRSLLAALSSKGIAVKLGERALRSVLDYEGEADLLRRYLAKNPDADKRILRREGFSQDAIDEVEDEDG